MAFADVFIRHFTLHLGHDGNSAGSHANTEHRESTREAEDGCLLAVHYWRTIRCFHAPFTNAAVRVILGSTRSKKYLVCDTLPSHHTEGMLCPKRL